MSWPDYFWMLGIGACCAFLLGLAVTAAHYQPGPKRSGFNVERKRP